MSGNPCGSWPLNHQRPVRHERGGHPAAGHGEVTHTVQLHTRCPLLTPMLPTTRSAWFSMRRTPPRSLSMILTTVNVPLAEMVAVRSRQVPRLAHPSSMNQCNRGVGSVPFQPTTRTDQGHRRQPPVRTNESVDHDATLEEPIRTGVFAAAITVVAVGCSSPPSTTPSTGAPPGGASTTPTTVGTSSTPNSPGVTATSINVGAISSRSGAIAADSDGLVPGVQAYFDMINAQGGINGRKAEPRLRPR